MILWMCRWSVQVPLSVVHSEFPVQSSASSTRYSSRERTLPPESLHRQHPARLCRPRADQQHAARVQAGKADASGYLRVHPVWGGRHGEGGLSEGLKDGACCGSTAAGCQSESSCVIVGISDNCFVAACSAMPVTRLIYCLLTLWHFNIVFVLNLL